jgi:hypothetical protein
MKQMYVGKTNNGRQSKAFSKKWWFGYGAGA